MDVKILDITGCSIINENWRGQYQSFFCKKELWFLFSRLWEIQLWFMQMK